jgi:hypothetical protein
MSANMNFEISSAMTLDEIHLTAAEDAECRAKAKAWVEEENKAATKRQRLEAMIDRPEVEPANFGCIFGSDIFRSSVPTEENVSFLHKYKIKSVISLSGDPLDKGYATYLRSRKVAFHEIIMSYDEEHQFTDRGILEAMAILVNPVHYPVLVHCDSDCYRTGALTAIYRRAVGAPVVQVIQDYEKFIGEPIDNGDTLWMFRFDQGYVDMFTSIMEENYNKSSTPRLRLAFAIESNCSTKRPVI